MPALLVLCIAEKQTLDSQVINMVCREHSMVILSGGDSKTLIVFRESTTSSASAHLSKHPLGSFHVGRFDLRPGPACPSIA